MRRLALVVLTLALTACRDHDVEALARAQKAVETAPRHLDDKGREHVMGLLDAGGRQSALLARHMLLTGSPEYHQDFEEYFESRGAYMGPHLRRAISLSPDSAGGALVPFTLDPTIILTNLGIVAGIRGLATVKQIVTDTWNGVTSAGVTAQWLAENTNADNYSGDLAGAVNGADVFIGVSAPNLLTGDDIATMAKNAIVFALANPDPEVDPREARKHAAIDRFVHPDEFRAYEEIAWAKGFLMVAASPLTRSSHHAGEDFARLQAARRAREAVTGTGGAVT